MIMFRVAIVVACLTLALGVGWLAASHSASNTAAQSTGTPTMLPRDTPLPVVPATPVPTAIPMPGIAAYATLGGHLRDWVAKFGPAHKDVGFREFVRCKDGTYGNYIVSPDATGMVQMITGEACDQAKQGYDWVAQASAFMPADSVYIGTELGANGTPWRFYNSTLLGQELPILTNPARDVSGTVLPPGAFSLMQDANKRWELSIFGY